MLEKLFWHCGIATKIIFWLWRDNPAQICPTANFGELWEEKNFVCALSRSGILFTLVYFLLYLYNPLPSTLWGV